MEVEAEIKQRADEEFSRCHSRLGCYDACTIFTRTLSEYDNELANILKSVIEENLPAKCTIEPTCWPPTRLRDYDLDCYSIFPDMQAEIGSWTSLPLRPPSFYPLWTAKRQGVLIELFSDAKFNGRHVIFTVMKAVAPQVLAGSYTTFDPKLEIALFCTILLRDKLTMRQILNEKSQLLPGCVKAALLGRALFHGSKEYPRFGIQVYCSCFENGILQLLRIGANPGYLLLIFIKKIESLTPPVKSRIVKMLIKNGADLRIRSKFHDANVLHLLHDVLLFLAAFPRTWMALIKAAPASALLEQIEDPDDVVQVPDDYQVLSREAIYERCSITILFVRAGSRMVSLDGNDLSLLYLYGLLQLLRAGAVCDPDVLESENVISYVNRLLALGQVALCFIVEIRQKSNFSPSDFQYAIDNFKFKPELYDNREFERQVYGSDEDCRKRLSIFLKMYPRSLQATCRTAILRLLPIGWKERHNAIQKLKLPDPLKHYLGYMDLLEMLKNATKQQLFGV